MKTKYCLLLQILIQIWMLVDAHGCENISTGMIKYVTKIITALLIIFETTLQLFKLKLYGIQNSFKNLRKLFFIK